MLGPIVWEAMAMATQQHYLVEIDNKLHGIAEGVDEILAREDDRTLAIFREVRDIVRDSRSRFDAGDELSSARVQEIQRLAGDARREWHVLNQRTRLLAAIREEHDRVIDAVDDIRELAAEMHASHLQWRSDWLQWQVHGNRNPVTNRVRAIRKQPVLTKPAQQGLGYDLARQLRELITPVTQPEAMLVTVKADGTIDVVPELAAA